MSNQRIEAAERKLKVAIATVNALQSELPKARAAIEHYEKELAQARAELDAARKAAEQPKPLTPKEACTGHYGLPWTISVTPDGCDSGHTFVLGKGGRFIVADFHGGHGENAHAVLAKEYADWKNAQAAEESTPDEAQGEQRPLLVCMAEVTLRDGTRFHAHDFFYDGDNKAAMEWWSRRLNDEYGDIEKMAITIAPVPTTVTVRSPQPSPAATWPTTEEAAERHQDAMHAIGATTCAWSDIGIGYELRRKKISAMESFLRWLAEFQAKATATK